MHPTSRSGKPCAEGHALGLLPFPPLVTGPLSAGAMSRGMGCLCHTCPRSSLSPLACKSSGQTLMQRDLVLCESGAPGPQLARGVPDSATRFTPSCPALSPATCGRSSSPCRPSWTSSCCCSSSWSFSPSLVSPLRPRAQQPLKSKFTVEETLTLTVSEVQKAFTSG